MAGLQETSNPRRKEKVGTADLAFVGFIIIITAIAVMLTLVQIYLSKSQVITGRHGSRCSVDSIRGHWRDRLR